MGGSTRKPLTGDAWTTSNHRWRCLHLKRACLPGAHGAGSSGLSWPTPLAVGCSPRWWHGRANGFQSSEAVVIGVVFGQASLLAMWCGFGSSPWWSRLLVAAAGVGHFGLQLTLCVQGPRVVNFVIVFFVTVLEAGGFLLLRGFRYRICRSTHQKPAVRRMQFAIRDLMLLTFAVACFVTLAKWIAPFLTCLPPPFEFSVLVLVLAAVGLLSVWPVLGARRPLPAATILVVVAAGMGFCFVWSFGRDLEAAALWAALTATEALLLVVSLFVSAPAAIGWCGSPAEAPIRIPKPAGPPGMAVLLNTRGTTDEQSSTSETGCARSVRQERHCGHPERR